MPTPAHEPAGADTVVRRGKIFEVGDFPDKQFSMSSEELRSAVDQFSGPLPLDLEHVPTILDGKLGTLDSVWLSEDGRELHGSVAMPKWLDDLLAEGERKVSATWSRATKGLEKLALVRNPRVKDAAIFACFAAAHPDEAEVLFATPRKHHPHLTHVWQAIHDQCAMTPGICPANPVSPTTPVMMGDIPMQRKHLKTAHDNSVMHGAACSGRAMMTETSTRSNPMSSKADATESVAFADSPDFLAFKAKLDAAEARAAELAAKLAETSAESAATAAQFAATKAELETARVKQVGLDAKAFALAEITAGRSTAAEYKDLIADFSDAAEADHKSKELVTFSDATGASIQGTRVDKLRAREARRQSHGLFSPALGDGNLLRDGEKILFHGNGSDDKETVRAKADEVLARFNEGQAVLARKKAAK